MQLENEAAFRDKRARALEKKLASAHKERREQSAKHRDEIRKLHKHYIQMLQEREPLKPREDWTLPDAPKCPRCGKQLQPWGYNDCGEMHLYWGHGRDEDDCDDDIDTVIEWPFGEEQRCIDEDMEALGFTIDY